MLGGVRAQGGGGDPVLPLGGRLFGVGGGDEGGDPAHVGRGVRGRRRVGGEEAVASAVEGGVDVGARCRHVDRVALGVGARVRAVGVDGPHRESLRIGRGVTGGCDGVGVVGSSGRDHQGARFGRVYHGGLELGRVVGRGLCDDDDPRACLRGRGDSLGHAVDARAVAGVLGFFLGVAVHAHREDLGSRGDSGESGSFDGAGPDESGDDGAVPVGVDAAVGFARQVDAGQQRPAAEVRVGGLDAGVHDGDCDPAAF